MIQKKALLVQSASRSLIPLAIGGTSYLLKGFVAQNSLLDQITDLSFGAYTNYFGFLLVMLVIDLIFRIAQNSRATQASLDLEQQPEAKKLGSINEMLKSLAASIISYSLIFAAFYLIALMFFTAPATPLVKTSQPVFTQFNTPRILEQVSPAPKAPIVAQSPVPEKISLSIGNVLSTLNIDVTAMVLTKDKKIAFTTVNYYGTLKIIDISNEHYPTIISSLALKQTGPVFKIKTLVLSADEKTLYVSNSRDLEIVNITNIEAPVLLSLTQSTIFTDIAYLNVDTSFRTSLAIDEKTKTAYTGGLGLQVFDISDPRQPVILSAEKNNGNQKSELCLVQEKSILLVAKENMDVYDASVPQSLKLLNSFPADTDARSILLSDDSNTVYLLGVFGKTICFVEVSIADPRSPQIIKSLILAASTKSSSGFLAVSPNKTKLFFYVDDGTKYNLWVYDTVKRTSYQNQNSLVDNVNTMAFAHDGKTLIAGSKSQFVIIELNQDYPNSQIAGSASLWANLTLASSYQFVKTHPSGLNVFVLRSVTQAISPRLYSVLEIYDTMLAMVDSNPLLGTYQADQSFSSWSFSTDYNTIYLLGRQTLDVINVNDRRNPVRTKVYQMKNSDVVFSQFLPSYNGKGGFLATREDVSGDAKITFFNFTDSPYIEGFYTIDKSFSVSNVKMVLDKTNNLIVIDKEINIYNISNLTAPSLISSLPVGDNEIPPFVSSALLSPDHTLYLETYDDNQFTSLRIYDLTNLKSPYLLSDYVLPKFDSQSMRPAFCLGSDQQSGYVFQDNSLLKLNLSNLNYPVAIGTITLSPNKTEKINSVVISDNARFAISVTDKKQVKILDISTRYALYLKQEKFLLGQKYSDSVSILTQINGYMSNFDWILFDPSNYKIIKLSLGDIKIASNSFTLESTTAPLPSWITFDKQTNHLIVEPKSQANLGSYTFQAVISGKVNAELLGKLKIPAGKTADGEETYYSSEDILTQLVSLGYVDTQLFLTTNLGAYEDFLLPSKFASYKADIYNILKKAYSEAITGFSIVPSLSVSQTKSSIAISTLSTNDVILDIKLYPYVSDSQVRFLSKQYDLVLTALSEAKSRMILEGPLADVNAALRSIIVDLTNTTNYDAYITVSDGLNPPYSHYMVNASQYFLHNESPISNPSAGSLQEQIERISISTGQFFHIELDPTTFRDQNGNELSYQLQMEDQTAEIPTWLIFEKLTLHGTAPEDLTGRSLKMVLSAKNEFKEVRVPFVLNVKLTAKTVIMMVAKVAFILMMIVLAVSTIRSCGKKEDGKLPRDSKEYLLRRNLNKDDTYEVY